MNRLSVIDGTGIGSAEPAAVSNGEDGINGRRGVCPAVAVSLSSSILAFPINRRFGLIQDGGARHV